MKVKSHAVGYLYLLPVALLVSVFLFYPFLNGIVLSFFSTKFGFGEMSFAGFKNYLDILKDNLFTTAVKNSFVWVVVSLVLNTVGPMALAILLNRTFRGKKFTIAAMLIPWLTPVVGFAMMNKWLLEPGLGIVNKILENLGFIHHGINFIGSEHSALATMIILNFWQFCPFGVLLILSALSVISDEQYEAMKVDGANGWRIFIHLIIPVTGNMLGFLLFLGTVWTFSNYSLIYVTTKGGPSFSTYTLPMMIYDKAFNEFNAGQSSALATMAGTFLIIIGIIYFKFLYKPNEL